MALSSKQMTRGFPFLRNMKILFCTVASAAVSLACSITAPMQGTIWKTGELVTVSWAGASPDGVASISLAQGSKAAPPAAEEQVKVVAKLASEVSASEGKYAMKLPTNIAPSNDCNFITDYIILDEGGDKCSSAPIFIEQGSGSPDPEAPPNVATSTRLVGTSNPSMVTSSATADATQQPANGLGHHRGRTADNKNAAKERSAASRNLCAPEDAIWLFGRLLGTMGMLIFASAAVSIVF
ncbi:hypothetical protein VTP01DRAFT_10354 [Rhizomucor pusillus]|uniref:uncharacterized protein n=1 Tax=Rhizomucor pusillus TaxID=4840 RepID=UPI0037420B43